MMENKAPVRATAMHARSKTLVWWDMDNCPLPNGYEPSRLAPRIGTELKNLGYNGPLSIFALGNLEGISYDFLRALSSSGIAIKHVRFGGMSVFSDYCGWDDEPPTTIMIISDSFIVRGIIENLSNPLWRDCNLLLARPMWDSKPLKHPPSVRISGEWFWSRESLLKDSGFVEETRVLKQVREPFDCSLCDFSCYNFEDFTAHLDDIQHAEKIESFKQSKLLNAKRAAETRANASKEYKKEQALQAQEKAQKKAQALQAQEKAQALQVQEMAQEMARKMTKRLSKACFHLKFQSIPKRRTKRQSKAKKRLDKLRLLPSQ